MRAPCILEEGCAVSNFTFWDRTVMKLRSVVWLITLTFGTAAATPALAGHHGHNDDARDRPSDSTVYAEAPRDDGRDGRDGRVQTRDSARVSMDEAVGRVLSAYGGRVVAASSVSSGYRIRVLQDDGRVHTVFVDGYSGAMHE